MPGQRRTDWFRAAKLHAGRNQSGANPAQGGLCAHRLRFVRPLFRVFLPSDPLSLAARPHSCLLATCVELEPRDPSDRSMQGGADFPSPSLGPSLGAEARIALSRATPEAIWLARPARLQAVAQWISVGANAASANGPALRPRGGSIDRARAQGFRSYCQGLGAQIGLRRRLKRKDMRSPRASLSLFCHYKASGTSRLALDACHALIARRNAPCQRRRRAGTASIVRLSTPRRAQRALFPVRFGAPPERRSASQRLRRDSVTPTTKLARPFHCLWKGVASSDRQLSQFRRHIAPRRLIGPSAASAWRCDKKPQVPARSIDDGEGTGSAGRRR